MARRRSKYYYTPKRRAALKKAQLASARKRRNRNIAIGAGTVLAGTVAYHVVSGSKLSTSVHPRTSTATGKRPSAGVRVHRTKFGPTSQEVTVQTKAGPVKGVKVTESPVGASYGMTAIFGEKRMAVRWHHRGKAMKDIVGTQTKGKVTRDIGKKPPSADDLAHVSNRGKKYREEGKKSTGQGAGGASKSRAVGWGTYPLSEEYVAKRDAYNSTFERKYANLFLRARAAGI